MAKNVSHTSRDPRLDFFRGLSLFFIFIDHIPDNLMSYFTLHNVAFCDAAEVFIFISGYAAALVYGQALRQQGPLYAAAQVYRRLWQLYVAHVFIFMVYLAEVSYVYASIDNPIYSEELGVGAFLAQPHIAIVQAMILRFQPTYLDILPLYIVLLGIFPFILLALSKQKWLTLAASGLLYGATLWRGWAVPGYPPGATWYFNPLAWQFLFVIGAAAGLRSTSGAPLLPPIRWVGWVALCVVLLGAVINVSWQAHSVNERIPALLVKPFWQFSVDKSNLAPLRLANFLALAFVTINLVSADAAFLRWPLLRPILLCGQNSLPVFCLTILLSVTGHFVLSELSGGVGDQILVNLAGGILMVGTAKLIDWFKAARAVPAGAQG